MATEIEGVLYLHCLQGYGYAVLEGEGLPLGLWVLLVGVGQSCEWASKAGEQQNGRTLALNMSFPGSTGIGSCTPPLRMSSWW